MFAIFVGMVVSVPFALLAHHWQLEGWAFTAMGIPGMIVASLVDREGFYGPRDDTAEN